MPTISGSLKYVTSRPAAVTEVWVRARELRTDAGGLVTTSNDRAPVADGQVSFDALPGPAVLALVESGRPVETFPIVVGDAPVQSLETVVLAAELATGAQQDVLERLAAQVSTDAEVARAQRVAAEEARDKAKDSETSAATSATASAEGKELVLDAAAASVAAAQQIANLGVSVDMRVDKSVGTRVFAGDVMVFGESGWRNVTSLLVNGWTAALVNIRRDGNDVILRLYALDGTAATGSTILSLPDGFRFNGRGIGYTFGAQKITIGPGPQDVISQARASFGGHAYEGIEIRFKSFGWPSSLPGTPV